MPSYFICTNIYWLTRKANNIFRVIIIFLVCLVLIFSIYFNELSKGIIIEDSLCFYFLVSLLRGISCVLYVYVGHALRSAYDKMDKRLIFVISVIFLIVSFYLSYIAGYTNFSILDYGEHPFVLILLTIIGPIGFVVIMKTTFENHSCKLLQFIGQNSLYFMGLHTSLKLHTITKQLLINYFPENVEVKYYLTGCLCVLIMTIIIVPIVFLIRRCQKPKTI